MLESLKKDVCAANLRLVAEGLVVQTWGNVSAIDRPKSLVVIKPSGVAYDRMRPGDMVVVSLKTGAVVEGDLNPSSDTSTHLELYRAFPGIGGVVHTHSLYATAWAQARREIPAFGTTHADYYHGTIPCTRALTGKEITGDYEVNTGRVIVERFATLDPASFSGVLVASHAPFTWGKSAQAAVDSAVVLEFLCKLASETLRVAPATRAVPQVLLDKHYLRKHGRKAYYGQVLR
ncbi:MAG: L-ribulose-5-phosphate 4-epimerase AraD [bacterium]